MRRSGDSTVVDLTKPREQRPLTGLDIEQWRGENNLSKYDALHALGFRNTNQYNAECRRPLLRFETELLLRIYMEYPGPRAWDRYRLPELFARMYGEALQPFLGHPELETYARVDLAARFTRLFGRSGARQYEWLGERRDKPPAANAYVDAILSKLKTVPDPKEVLERLSAKCHALRGLDLDAEYPVPTPAHPPTRAKAGRRPRAQQAGATRAPQAGAPKAARKAPAPAPKRAVQRTVKAAPRTAARTKAR